MVQYEEAVKQEVQRLSLEMPTTAEVPGCMALLDTFFQCYGQYLCHTDIKHSLSTPLALGSQFRSLYRYGRSAECSEKLQDFKYCLSTKGFDDEERRAAWIQRRAEWWARRRVEKSSEDVWEMRSYVVDVLLHQMSLILYLPDAVSP